MEDDSELEHLTEELKKPPIISDLSDSDVNEKKKRFTKSQKQKHRPSVTAPAVDVSSDEYSPPVRRTPKQSAAIRKAPPTPSSPPSDIDSDHSTKFNNSEPVKKGGGKKRQVSVTSQSEEEPEKIKPVRKSKRSSYSTDSSRHGSVSPVKKSRSSKAKSPVAVKEKKSKKNTVLGAREKVAPYSGKVAKKQPAKVVVTSESEEEQEIKVERKKRGRPRLKRPKTPNDSDDLYESQKKVAEKGKSLERVKRNESTDKRTLKRRKKPVQRRSKSISCKSSDSDDIMSPRSSSPIKPASRAMPMPAIFRRSPSRDSSCDSKADSDTSPPSVNHKVEESPPKLGDEGIAKDKKKNDTLRKLFTMGGGKGKGKGGGGKGGGKGKGGVIVDYMDSDDRVKPPSDRETSPPNERIPAPCDIKIEEPRSPPLIYNPAGQPIMRCSIKLAKIDLAKLHLLNKSKSEDIRRRTELADTRQKEAKEDAPPVRVEHIDSKVESSHKHKVGDKKSKDKKESHKTSKASLPPEFSPTRAAKSALESKTALVKPFQREALSPSPVPQ